MNKLPLEPPEHLKKSLRTLMLAQLGSDTLDIFELELFDWYVKETESVLRQMLAGEHAYIQEQIAAGTPDVNDSGMVAVDYYGKRLRYSHIIYLTSLLETCLERACTTLTTAIGKDAVPFSLEDLGGDQWSKRRKFLERKRPQTPVLTWAGWLGAFVFGSDVDDPMQQFVRDAPLAFSAGNGGGLLVQAHDRADVLKQIAPLESNRVAQTDGLSSEHRSRRWLRGRLMPIDEQRSVFDPDVAAVIAMDQHLVGLELRDASPVHAPIA